MTSIRHWFRSSITIKIDKDGISRQINSLLLHLMLVYLLSTPNSFRPTSSDALLFASNLQLWFQEPIFQTRPITHQLTRIRECLHPMINSIPDLLIKNKQCVHLRTEKQKNSSDRIVSRFKNCINTIITLKFCNRWADLWRTMKTLLLSNSTRCRLVRREITTSIKTNTTSSQELRISSKVSEDNFEN